MTPDSPSPLQQQTLAFFAADGPLARGQPGYLPRPGQQQMALAVAEAIEGGERLVVEAGTGVGKTYAYLVPALLSGRRLLVVTATKALQDQLHGRDLPAVARALGLPLRVALLKGRGSYLCRLRLTQAWQRLPGGDRELDSQLRQVESWASCTVSGDLAELPGLDDASPVVPLVTSNRDNCLGAQCPVLESCHLNAARRAALAADVVVVNHHLFFADQALRESGRSELLPQADLVVLDEAHRLLETGVQFLGLSLTSAELQDWLRDVALMGRRDAAGLRPWGELAAALAQALQQLRACLGPGRPAGTTVRLGWEDGSVPAGVVGDEWRAAGERLRSELVRLCQALEELAPHSAELDRLHGRGLGLLGCWDGLAAGGPGAGARWVELGTAAAWRLVWAPLELAQGGGLPWLQESDALRRAWLFTSATLGSDEALSGFTQPLGLSGAKTLRVDSPFDYARQAALHVPPDLPLPSDRHHSQVLARTIWPWVLKLGGRTLVLTTTLRALEAVARELEELSAADLGPRILVQGRSPKRELLERFRRAGPGQGAVLVASASFWEGVDLAGDCLQMVVIDKLPFPPPDDPWVEAQSQAIELAGRRPFKDYFLPQAALALKQGAGRLIRSETDQGLLVVGDRRLTTMPYGRLLLAALPPLRRLEPGLELQAWLDQLLTAASTTDLPWT